MKHDCVMYERIENPDTYRIYGEDYISSVTILKVGCDFSLEQYIIPLSDLKWHEEMTPDCDEGDADKFLWLSLSEIAEQLGKERTITIIVESPTNGTIYRYGNHGDSWEIVGRMCGYA